MDAAFQAELDAALEGMAGEAAQLAAQEPRLFGALDFPTADEDATWMAFEAATLALADLRVRAGLQVPLGSQESLGTPEEAAAWCAAFRASLVQDAGLVVAQTRKAQAPAQGPALETALLRALPAYGMVADEQALAFLLASSHDAGGGPAIPALLGPLAQFEARRVAWQYLDAAALEGMQPDGPALGVENVRSLQANATYSPLVTTSHGRDAGKAAQQGLRALRMGDAFAGLAFTAYAELAQTEALAAARAAEGADLGALVRQEYVRLADHPASPLTLHALEPAKALLEAGEPDVANGSQEGARGPIQAPGLPETLGRMAAADLLRGLPPADLGTAPLGTSADAKASGFPWDRVAWTGLAVLAVSALALRLAGRRSA